MRVRRPPESLAPRRVDEYRVPALCRGRYIDGRIGIEGRKPAFESESFGIMDGSNGHFGSDVDSCDHGSSACCFKSVDAKTASHVEMALAGSVTCYVGMDRCQGF